MARIPFHKALIKPDTKFVVVKETASITEVYPARVLCTDLKGSLGPVLVLYTRTNGTGEYECIQQFTVSGEAFSAKTLSLWMDEPETWIIRRKSPYVVHYMNKEYPSKEAAQFASGGLPEMDWKPVRVVTE